MDHPLIEAWHEASARLLPPDTTIWDSHTHTGSSDPDGYSNDVGALIAGLDDAGHAGAVVCPHADPNGYRAQNARILMEAQASGGRLIPFMRVDPKAPDAAREVSRLLAEGFRGVKLHPRSEGFAMNHPGVAEVAAAAAERRAPILVHAGRGMPPLGEAALDLIDATPGLTLVLAHCAISDLGWIGPESKTRPGLMFDTAWWNLVDHLELYSAVDAGQVMYASDMPYWAPKVAATLATRAAAQAGLSGPALRAVLGGNLTRLLEGGPRESFGIGVGTFAEAALLRVASNLYAAIGAARSGAIGVEAIDLAMRATEAAPSPHESLLRAIRATIGEAMEAAERHMFAHITFLLLACGAALTPLAGAPDLP